MGLEPNQDISALVTALEGWDANYPAGYYWGEYRPAHSEEFFTVQRAAMLTAFSTTMTADYLAGGGPEFEAALTELQGLIANDHIVGDAGGVRTDDVLATVQNADFAVLDGLRGNDTLTGGDYTDVLRGGGDNDSLSGRGGDDILKGGTGDDTLDGGTGNDRIDGGDGIDLATFASATSAVQVSLDINGVQDTGQGRDLLLNIENLAGSQYGDALEGSTTDNELFGGDGADALSGLEGNDTLYGGFGADSLFGGAGNDMLDGGAISLDNMAGGAGDDTYVVYAPGDVVVENANEGIDLVQSWTSYELAANIENITLLGSVAFSATGNALANVVTGNTGRNVLSGGGGNDTLIGGGGYDSFFGEDGTDTVRIDAASSDIAVARSGGGVEISAAGWRADIAPDIEFIAFSDSTISVAQLLALAPSLGGPGIYGDHEQGAVLVVRTLDLDLYSSLTVTGYQWLRDGNEITGATETSLTMTQDDVGAQISVRVSYQDAFLGAQSIVTAETTAIANVNDAVQGELLVTGNLNVGEVLTADASGITDGDGLGEFRYVWTSLSLSGTQIRDEQGPTYTLTVYDVGKQISARLVYTDLMGTVEFVDSATTNLVRSRLNTDPVSTLPATLTSGLTAGDSTFGLDLRPYFSDGEGDTIRLSASGLPSGVSFNSAGVLNFNNFTPEDGAVIPLTITASDNYGGSVSADFNWQIDRVNAAPTGELTLGGSTVSWRYLTVNSSLADADGIDTTTISYEWLHDGVGTGQVDVPNISQSRSIYLRPDDIGSQISLRVTYTDLLGNVETVISPESAVITRGVNQAPSSAQTVWQNRIEVVAGAVVVLDLGQHFSDADNDTLTFSATGLPDGAAIDPGTGVITGTFLAPPSFSLSFVITASDGYGGTASKNIYLLFDDGNTDPTGGVTITGTTATGQTLSVASTVADVDGIDQATISYEWWRDWQLVDGASGDTYFLTSADIGASIAVLMNFTDLLGKAYGGFYDESALVVEGPNTAPVSTLPTTLHSVEGALTLDLSSYFDDAERDPLTFLVTGLPDGVTLDPATGVISGALPSTGAAVPISVTVSDGRGGSVTDSFDWQIDQPPCVREVVRCSTFPLFLRWAG